MEGTRFGRMYPATGLGDDASMTNPKELGFPIRDRLQWRGRVGPTKIYMGHTHVLPEKRAVGATRRKAVL